MKKIVASKRISFWVLLVAWFLIVLLPPFVYRKIQNLYFSSRFEQSIRKARPMMFTELQQFASEIDEKIWLEKKMKLFDEENGYITRQKEVPGIDSFESITARELHKKLEDFLRIPVLAVFNYGPDIANVDSHVRKFAYSEVKSPPSVVLKRFFHLLTKQETMAALDPVRYENPFSSSAKDAEKNRLLYFGGFLKRTFGTMIPVFPQRKFVLKVIAGRCGDTGPILFYHSSSIIAAGRKKYNAGGYFAVVRVQDIPEAKLIKDVLDHSFYKDFQRRVLTAKHSLPVPENFTDKVFSGFFRHNDRLVLQTLAPERLLVRLSQHGTIVPYGFRNVQKKTPVIEVSVPYSSLNHPLQEYQLLIDVILFIMTAAGTLICIRSYLFGFDQRTAFAVKVMVAVTIACFIPSVSIFLARSAYDDYEASAERESCFRQLKLGNSFLRNRIESHLENWQQETLKLADELGRLRDSDQNFHKDLLTKWMKNRPVAGILFKRLDFDMIDIWEDEHSRRADFKTMRNAKSMVMYSLMEFLESSTVLTPDQKSVSKVITEGADNVETNHFITISEGKLLHLPRISESTRISVAVVNNFVNGRRIPMGILIVDYDAIRLSEAILQQTKTEVFWDKSEAGMHEEIFAGLVEDGRIRMHSSGRRSDKNLNDTVFRQFEVCRTLKKDIQIHERHGDNEVFCLSQNFGILPLVVCNTMTVKAADGDALLKIAAVLYSIMILALAMILSQAFFIKPAMRLVKGLGEVAGGNLSARFEVSTGDEFEEIARECSAMTAGLIEKARMEQYVSPELLQEIRNSSESELTPGGERINATVVFAMIRPAGVSEGVGSDQTVMLDLFFGLCDAICMQNNGMVDKIIGNTIMMVFRDRKDQNDHRISACTAIVQISAALEGRNDCGRFVISAGLSSGPVVSGKIGSRSGKLDYTVIGDVVNMAARLKAHAAGFAETGIICSDALAGLSKDTFEIRPEGMIRIKGKSERCAVYRLKLRA